MCRVNSSDSAPDLYLLTSRVRAAVSSGMAISLVARCTGLRLRQGDATPGEIDIGDLHGEHVADLHHVSGRFVQLAGVHEPFEAVLAFFDAHEDTERHDLGDWSGDHLPCPLRDLRPRVFLHCSERQWNPFPDHVDIEDLGRDLLAAR